MCMLRVSNLPLFLRLDLDCSDSVIRVFFNFFPLFLSILFFFHFVLSRINELFPGFIHSDEEVLLIRKDRGV